MWKTKSSSVRSVEVKSCSVMVPPPGIVITVSLPLCVTVRPSTPVMEVKALRSIASSPSVKSVIVSSPWPEAKTKV